MCEENTRLESLVLEDALDGSILIGWSQLGLKNNAKRAVSDDLALSVLYLPRLASDAILYLLLDYL